MITKDHELSISAQARLLNISRSTTYYTPRPPSAQDLTLMRQLDELHLKHPTMGSRMLRDQLNRMGYHVGRRHVSTLMKKMGMMPYPANVRRASSILAIRSILTSCGAWPLIKPTKYGRWIRRIFQWQKVLCI